ncbi:protein of unknown function DUF1559 [Pirellula staleyi DSM 6068]|uniref:DUF1559 domain-containing protein n=1 Tax=Pirellula staleyi (strain ATCC 27377 / DSM 6068 / ICPB 4128) TaxID=530564 RepID=D2R7U7_PIRSD|nr:DUF1559 domain-containing protein [Pirellula staleyi]ADB19278.1 protein of unknown function DUF1559 [Pirellula staleyi DSM 6068]
MPSSLSTRTNIRRAFTLVELLVVIAIIGVLVALLLPAVQAARESSRRTKCANNLKQLSLSVHLFHDSFRKIPPNRYGDYDGYAKWNGPYEDSRSWSWIATILPYLEQRALYEKTDIPNRTLVASSTSIETALPMLHCPSDGGISSSGFVENTRYMRGIKVGLTNYKGVQGSNFCWGDWAHGSTDFDQCEPWWKGDGPLYPMDWQKPRGFEAIRDGMSSTFLVGEDVFHPTRATCSDPCYGLGFAWAHPVEASAVGAMPPNARRPDGTPYANNDWTGYNGFRSRHPQGVQFALCDGSVRYVSDTIALGIYRSACTIAGGEAVSLP